MPGTGLWFSMAQQEPEALELVRNSTCGSRPSVSPRLKASATAIIEMLRIMLLQILAAWPLPGPPAWTMVRPMDSNSGLPLAKAASGTAPKKGSEAATRSAERGGGEGGVGQVRAEGGGENEKKK